MASTSFLDRKKRDRESLARRKRLVTGPPQPTGSWPGEVQVYLVHCEMWQREKTSPTLTLVNDVTRIV